MWAKYNAMKQLPNRLNLTEKPAPKAAIDPLLLQIMKKQAKKVDEWAKARRPQTTTAQGTTTRRKLSTPKIKKPVPPPTALPTVNPSEKAKSNKSPPTVNDLRTALNRRLKTTHNIDLDNVKPLPTTTKNKADTASLEEGLRTLKERLKKIKTDADTKAHTEVNSLLQLTDAELILKLAGFKGSEKEVESVDKSPENGKTAKLFREVKAPGTGTVFQPGVWAVPQGKIRPPGTYLDKNYLKYGPNIEDFNRVPLLNVGPFGVGEAKACLDDLQAHLLSYYGKVYNYSKDLPVDYVLNELGASYYPSVTPISPVANADPVNLAEAAGALPPVPPVSNNDLELTKTQIVLPAPVTEKNEKPQVPQGASIPTVKRDAGTVMNELFELADGNSKRIDGMLQTIYDDIYDPTSTLFYRNSEIGNLKAPKYTSNGPYKSQLIELEDTLDTMYKNLKVSTEWNARKIQLLQDRLRLINKTRDGRIAN